MLRRLVFLCAALAGDVFAKDANQPVKQDALELGVGYGYAAIPGIYDAHGDYKNWSELFGGDTGYAPALYGIPIRLKYGLGHGVDLKADWDAVFSNADAGNARGMSQPKVGLKYAGPVLGAFTHLTLPFATGDLDNGHLHTYLEVGGLARKRIDSFRLTGLLSYTEVFDQKDILRASVKPEVLWNNKISNYFTMEYLKSLGKDAYLAAVTPGLRADVTEALTVDLNAPFTVAGRNAPAGWSLKVILYRTLGR